jgi:predicted nucleic acid-binding protein
MNEFEPTFVDTWGWLAFGHRRDSHHEVVRSYLERLLRENVPIYTSDYVLDETIPLIFRREQYKDARSFVGQLFRAIEDGEIQREQATTARFGAAWTLRRPFQDKPDISFTDLTSMAIMQEMGLSHVLTGDSHFEHVGFNFRLVP